MSVTFEGRNSMQKTPWQWELGEYEEPQGRVVKSSEKGHKMGLQETGFWVSLQGVFSLLGTRQEH